MIAGKLKLYFDGSWTHLDTSHEILLKVVVDNGSDVDNATTDHFLSGVWRFEFSRSFPRRWTRLGVLEHSRIFPRRKLDTSSFSVGRLGNFFIRGPRSLLISDFLAKVAHGVAGLATLPHSKLGDIWSTNPPELGNVCLDDAGRRSSSRGLGNFFTRGPRSLLISRFFGQSCSRGGRTCYPAPPTQSSVDIWSTNPPDSATFVWTTPTVVRPALDSESFFTSTSVSRIFWPRLVRRGLSTRKCTTCAFTSNK